MSDIVKRLRRLGFILVADDMPSFGSAMREAAAEITRLRAELAAAQEREQRMREALERLASMEGFSGNFRMKLNNEAAELKARIDFARAALSAMRGEP